MKRAKRKPSPSVIIDKRIEKLKTSIEWRLNIISSLYMMLKKDLK